MVGFSNPRPILHIINTRLKISHPTTVAEGVGATSPIQITGKLYSTSAHFALTLTDLLHMVTLQANLHIIKVSPLVTTQTNHILNLVFNPVRIGVDTVVSAVTAFTVLIGESQALPEVLPLVGLVAAVEALRLPNFRIFHGHPRLEHEAVALPPKRHAHSLFPHHRR